MWDNNNNITLVHKSTYKFVGTDTKVVKMAVQHRTLWFTVILMTFFIFLTVLGLNIAGVLGVVDSVFPRPLGWRNMEMGIAILPWAQILFVIAMFWQLLWLCYGLSTLCRRVYGSSGYLYFSPPYMPGTMYAMFAVSQICILANNVTLSYGFVPFALAFRAVAMLTLHACLIISGLALYRQTPELVRMGLQRHIEITRGLVQNGLTMYVAYVDYTTLTMLAGVLIQATDLSENLVYIIIQVIYLVWLILNIIGNLTFMDRYFRFGTVMYSITAVVMMLSVLIRNWEREWGAVKGLVVANFAIACISMLARFIAMCVRPRKRDNVKK